MAVPQDFNQHMHKEDGDQHYFVFSFFRETHVGGKSCQMLASFVYFIYIYTFPQCGSKVAYIFLLSSIFSSQEP